MNSNIKEEWLHSRNWFDYQGLYQAVACAPFKCYVEIGSWKGHSISYLAQQLLLLKKDFELYAIDLWEDSKMPDVQVPELPYIFEIFQENLQRVRVEKFVKSIHSDSVKASFLFQDGAVDFVFIDADHSYESVTQDIIHWKPKVKSGGILAGHDYYDEQVKRAVDEQKVGQHIVGNCWLTFI